MEHPDRKMSNLQVYMYSLFYMFVYAMNAAMENCEKIITQICESAIIRAIKFH